ncbi:hypothetical protein [Saccharothrix hoggarensis]|uniref:Uncharacterized protein n=1 Tax=Saccharothrix hoggarensis TaxID=913853 RepID=A0ABW3QV50_9PSEU
MRVALDNTGSAGIAVRDAIEPTDAVTRADRTLTTLRGNPVWPFGHIAPAIPPAGLGLPAPPRA